MGKKFCHLKKFYDQTLMGSYPLKIFQKNFFSREKVLSSPHARHKPITCQTCKCILCRIDSRGSIGVHLRTCNILHGSSLSVRPVDQKRRQLAVGVCSKQYVTRSGVGVLAMNIRLVMNSYQNNLAKLALHSVFKQREVFISFQGFAKNVLKVCTSAHTQRDET